MLDWLEGITRGRSLKKQLVHICDGSVEWLFDVVFWSQTCDLTREVRGEASICHSPYAAVSSLDLMPQRGGCVAHGEQDDFRHIDGARVGRRHE